MEYYTVVNNVSINNTNRVEYPSFKINILSLYVCGLKGNILMLELFRNNN